MSFKKLNVGSILKQFFLLSITVLLSVLLTLKVIESGAIDSIGINTSLHSKKHLNVGIDQATFLPIPPKILEPTENKELGLKNELKPKPVFINPADSAALAAIATNTGITATTAGSILTSMGTLNTKTITVIQRLTSILSKNSSILSAITGGRRMGNLNNSLADKNSRKNPNSFENIRRHATLGEILNNDPQADLKNRISRLKDDYALDDLDDLGSLTNLRPLFGNSEIELNEGFRNAGGSAIAATAVAEQSYERALKNLGRIDGYLNSINSANDLKKSLDLNNRLLVELIETNNQRMQLEAASTISISANSIQGISARLSKIGMLKFVR